MGAPVNIGRFNLDLLTVVQMARIGGIAIGERLIVDYGRIGHARMRDEWFGRIDPVVTVRMAVWTPRGWLPVRGALT